MSKMEELIRENASLKERLAVCEDKLIELGELRQPILERTAEHLYRVIDSHCRRGVINPNYYHPVKRGGQSYEALSFNECMDTLIWLRGRKYAEYRFYVEELVAYPRKVEDAFAWLSRAEKALDIRFRQDNSRVEELYRPGFLRFSASESATPDEIDAFADLVIEDMDKELR